MQLHDLLQALDAPSSETELAGKDEGSGVYSHLVAILSQDAEPLPASSAAIARMPEAVARRHQVCPLAEVRGSLVLACGSLPAPRAQQELRLAAGQPIRLIEMEPLRVREALELHYGFRVTWQQLPGSDRDLDCAAMVDEILSQAVRLRATDIHLGLNGKGLAVQYRVDGVLQQAPLLPAGAASGVLARIKVLADLDIVERRRPQDGSMVGPNGTPVRVSTIATRHGEQAALRLHLEGSARRLDSLGLLPQQLAQWRQAIEQPHGLILVAGPTGSGKTSTLYATLEGLDRGALHVVSLEDPVERVVEGVSQIPVSAQAGVDWANGLRAVLRQDPDVIAVGEIRDRTTAVTAVQAAMTGHLVLATVHASSVPTAIYRLIDLGVPPWMVASAVSHVLGQRLVRRVCKRCLHQDEPAVAELAFWYRWMQERPPGRLVHSSGCPACRGTGFAGRMAVAEILMVSDEIRDLIAAGAPPSALASRLTLQNWLPMQRAGCMASRAGVTTLAEVMRAVG